MGSAASQVPAQVDLNTFRRLSGVPSNGSGGGGGGGGGTQAAVDALFETYAVNGVMSREKLFEVVQGN